MPLVLIPLLAVPVRARPGAEDPALPDTTQRASNPRTALLLGLVPGGGQLYNRKWGKAALVMAADGYSMYQLQRSLRLYHDFESSNAEGENPYIGRRNRDAWRVLLIYLLGIMDGYVDAHLSTFPRDGTSQADSSFIHSNQESP